MKAIKPLRDALATSENFLRTNPKIIESIPEPVVRARTTILDAPQMLQAATRVVVFTQVINVAEKKGLEKAKVYVLGRIRGASRHPLRATCPIACYQHTLELETLGEALDSLEDNSTEADLGPEEAGAEGDAGPRLGPRRLVVFGLGV